MRRVILDRWIRRRAAPPTEFPEAWRLLLERRWYQWRYLSADQCARLELRTLEFIAAKRWEAARGTEVTEEMQVLIAAQASFLVLELGPEYLRSVGSLIIHPSTVVLRGERSVGAGGLMTDDPFAIEGQARFGGPVLIAWDAVLRDAAWPQRGRNVVFHEFAHAIDMLDRVLDGTPPIADVAARQRWVAVCTRVFDWLRETEDDSVLRDYAITNPGEFFAVATETFLTRPAALRDEQPQLYEVLRDFYGHDPAAQVPGMNRV